MSGAMSDAEVVTRRLADHGLIDPVTGEASALRWSLMTFDERITTLTAVYAGTAWSVTANADGTITWLYGPLVDTEIP